MPIGETERVKNVEICLARELDMHATHIVYSIGICTSLYGYLFLAKTQIFTLEPKRNQTKPNQTKRGAVKWAKKAFSVWHV